MMRFLVVIMAVAIFATALPVHAEPVQGMQVASAQDRAFLERCYDGCVHRYKQCLARNNGRDPEGICSDRRSDCRSNCRDSYWESLY